MSIKLLLDENLSERLLPLLSEAFPGSTPIRLLGLGGVDDRAVWDEARSSGSVLLTKDDDFLGMSDVTPFIGPGAMRVGGYAAAA